MTFKSTAGNWSMTDAPIYFRASLLSHIISMRASDITSPLEERAILLALSGIWLDKAVDEKVDEELKQLRGLCGEYKVLLDSGAFGLAVRHSRTHGISLADALGGPVHQIDGYDTMLSNWRKVISELGDSLWGYIELDLGGRDQKRSTRVALEAEGYSPIPVFHALTDGWDYFDELADTYKRVCVGNLVSARHDKKKEIFATIQQRRAGKRVEWIHYLGVTPTRDFISSPVESCDSTSYYSDVMYGGEARSLEGFMSANTDLHYVRKDSDYRTGDRGKAYHERIKALEVMASCASRAMRHHLKVSGNDGGNDA